VGAAIHLAPNANGILRRYGLYAETFGGVYLTHVTRYDDKGIRTKAMNLEESNKLWQHPWQLVHRVRLYEELKRVAVSENGAGKPAVLHTSSKVTDVATDTGIITLENGTTIKADVVLGADGVYSRTRSFVSGRESEIFGSGKAAFRFLVARQKVLANPETANLVEW
jgi:2-polyprenyl-6-methoxyphenol hydroxylase-like FAD-dependent oxidoreductase